MVLQRLEQVRTRMVNAQLDALLISSSANRRWLTGFSGSAGSVIIGQDCAFLLVDARYVTQAKDQAPQFEIIEYVDFYQVAGEMLAGIKAKRAGFETEHVVHKTWQNLQTKIPLCEWVAVDDWIEQLRGIKNADELALMAKAIAIADEAFEKLLPYIRPGVSERQVALVLERLLREGGAERLAFDTIVVSGPRGALPHGAPTDKLIQQGELVTLDFGAVWQGYHSDITRTVAVGSVDPKQKEIYDLVLRAQQVGIAAAVSGRTGKQVDAMAREVIAVNGYGDNFGHGLGHGIGLEVHERYPRLSRAGESVLAEGMICSVEPGIYIPGWGGVRIEDLVCVTAEGPQVLTGATKELLILQ
ncbi:MAG: M24 family metallopeptidase [Limnochordia bacterium]